MRRPAAVIRPVLLLAALCPLPAAGANRFWVEGKDLRAAVKGQSIALGCDNDAAAYGFMMVVVYEPAKLAVTAVDLIGAAAAADLVDVQVTEATGEILVSAIIDKSPSDPPTSDKVIPAGTSNGLVRITADVLLATAGSTLIDFRDRPARPDGVVIRNMLANGSATTLFPSLVDRTVAIASSAPDIFSVNGNSGRPGKSFFVMASNLDIPGIAIRVQVCGVDLVQDDPAGFRLAADLRTLVVTAPACATIGFVPVTVATDYGTDTETNGFEYQAPALPTIDSISGNEGLAGTVFQVTGKNFDRSGLAVKVGGAAAAAVLRSDHLVLDVTAPPNALGWAPLEVCTGEGCASVGQGFHYVATLFVRGDANDDGEVDISDVISILGDMFLGAAAKAPCRDALDTDDSGSLDVTDGIYLLTFLFLGGLRPPEPYPDPGIDPTADGLPSC